MSETLQETCVRLEHFETPEWAARAILNKEILTHNVLDPCCGTGVLTEAARHAGYDVWPIDIQDWGFPCHIYDFLESQLDLSNATIFMNPPFSRAVEFVKKAFELGARKIVCFQRFAWYESAKRRPFWDKYPPNRIYICSDRATCYRNDLTEKQRKDMSNVPVAHAWFVWERGNPAGTLLGYVSK